MRRTARVHSIAPLWQPVAVLPSQLADRRNGLHSPEMRLVAAMFEDARRSVFRHADARRGPRRREFLAACDWLLDDSRDWPFAFANVCDLLGLDAAAVRQFLFYRPSGRRARFAPEPLDHAAAASRRGLGGIRPRARPTPLGRTRRGGPSWRSMAATIDARRADQPDLGGTDRMVSEKPDVPKVV